MKPFLGSHDNRLDSKNRVSIPATFRNVLRDGEVQGSIVLRPSRNYPAIEGWTAEGFASLAVSLQEYATFSPDHDDLSWDIYASAAEVEPDREGRVVLPASMIEHAGLADTVTFVGIGTRFEIWDKAAVTERRAQATRNARERNLELHNSRARPAVSA